MHETRTPVSANAPIRFFGMPTVIRAISLFGAVILAVLPATAYGQSLNNNVLRLADPITVVQPNLRLANPALTLNPAVLRPLVPSTSRIATILAPTVNPTARTTGMAPSVAATGLGRLVAPGTENASAVVARIGSTARADVSSLTVDFDGDGLINFEIAPGIVEFPTDKAGQGDDALGGLVGQHITMATATADRVLDSVINIAGVTPATTFEMANGTVVLGGSQPRDVADVVVDIPVPDDPPSRDPGGTDGRDPVGGSSQQQGEICLSHGCYPGAPPDPKPDAGPDLEGVFNFSGIRRPPRPESAQSTGTDELLNVSIILPLRGREREGDQFSNYGNEEIW